MADISLLLLGSFEVKIVELVHHKQTLLLMLALQKDPLHSLMRSDGQET
jgi:hypothetical protein